MQDLLWLKPQVLKTPPAVHGGDSRTSWPAAPPRQAIILLIPCLFSLQINFTFYIQCVYIIGELYRFCLLNVPSLCTSHPPSRPVPATQSLPSPHWWFSPLQVCVQWLLGVGPYAKSGGQRRARDKNPGESHKHNIRQPRRDTHHHEQRAMDLTRRGHAGHHYEHHYKPSSFL